MMDGSAVSAMEVALEMCTFTELLMAALTISVAFMTIRGAGAEPAEGAAAGLAAVGGGPSWMVGMVGLME